MSPETNRQVERWNTRFSSRTSTPGADPYPLLSDAVSGLPPGRALDLGSGAGRHALWLAERGWRVVAVDGSDVGVGLMLAAADRSACRDRIEPHVADLEADPPRFAIEESRYDLIIDCFFLHRALFPAIRLGVRPGGMFLAALHVPSADNSRGHGYLLAPGELMQTVGGWGWRIVHACERDGAESGYGVGTAELVMVRPGHGEPAVETV